ncbi:BAG domain-containing protein Samui isoform X2 [Nasonia vitripennis]|uniref:BAG domain-containing protein n=1 Tax=Nasonia vitripennis TaxID=7425 RepID=A0A7M7GDI9_NASVI|nr:BAG domain-containing protein Samui isoform X2 [Nasonia vitripennis]
MDSPIIVDNAMTFGRGIDLEREFPGFPFDDEGFGRRADIRSHLDDLAARHPEFADHLLGPPWADVPFAGRNRRRDSADRATSFHNQPDEDARSQASGGSAASGASGVSSHGSDPEEQQQSGSKQQIPQYGLRNTVDIGQHQHNMENPQQQRNVRSMSAPPENRNNQEQANGQPRFVSRVEITPHSQAEQQQQQQQQQQPQPQSQREKSPAPQQKPQPQSQQHGNVRHIPIFVEGRDKPVIPKEVDEPDFARRQQSPPQFHRPSHYQQHYQKPQADRWATHFGDPFFEPPTTGRWGQPPQSQFRHTQPQEKPKPHPEPQHTPRQRAQPQQPKPQPQQQQQQQQPPHSEPQPEAPPKPRQQVQPKDPLERVAEVQKEVDALNEQVKEYSGNSRQDKQYMYLDEMLTRELIKLDDIETEGKDNVRQARKQAIKSIQDSISLLESKAPLPGQQPEEQQKPEESETPKESMDTTGDEKPAESMETTEAPASEEHKAAIPLPPPCPSSPTKTAPEAQTEEASKNAQPSENNVQNQEATTTTTLETQVETVTQDNAAAQPAQNVDEKQTAEPMDSSAAPPVEPQASSDIAMEVRQSSPAKELQLGAEQQQSQALIVNDQMQEAKDAAAPAAEITAEKVKKEPPPVPAKPSKSPKKAKKTKKQPEPVSETAIPLPAPVSETAIPLPAPVSETAIPLPAPGQSI